MTRKTRQLQKCAKIENIFFIAIHIYQIILKVSKKYFGFKGDVFSLLKMKFFNLYQSCEMYQN